MIELKEQMNQILDKHIEFVEDESYETLDKYKMIFSDIKILMREYINTRNEEYLQMIWRSLEPHDWSGCIIIYFLYFVFIYLNILPL